MDQVILFLGQNHCVHIHAERNFFLDDVAENDRLYFLEPGVASLREWGDPDHRHFGPLAVERDVIRRNLRARTAQHLTHQISSLVAVVDLPEPLQDNRGEQRFPAAWAALNQAQRARERLAQRALLGFVQSEIQNPLRFVLQLFHFRINIYLRHVLRAELTDPLFHGTISGVPEQEFEELVPLVSFVLH